MRLETQQAIDGAIDEFERDVVRSLTVNAFNEYRVADAEATAQANKDAKLSGGAPGGGGQPPPKFDPMQWAVIDQAAMGYIAEYRRILVEEGVINGQKIPWMRDFTQEARTRVSMIIEEGIAEGLYPGRVETGIGTYPKKSTAAKLQELFHDRKSHAATVARTETANIRGLAKAARWKEREYSIVLGW